MSVAKANHLRFLALLAMMTRIYGISPNVLYKRGIKNVDATTWNDNVQSINGVRSIFVCGSICKKRENCNSFKLDRDQEVCEWGSLNADDWCDSTSPVGGSIAHEIYSEVTESTLHLGSGETSQTRLMKSTSDKANWVADQGMPIQGDVSNAGGHLAIDGLLNDIQFYHSKWPNADPSYPWVQVQMDKTYWVKGVVLIQRSAWGGRHTHKEIRVGNADIGGTPLDQMICQNQLCYTSAEDTTAILEADCASPIEGQYVTVQKYSYKTNEDNINEIIEINVNVYCGPFLSSSGNIDTCIIDETDACIRQALAIGKNPVLMDTPGEKSSWVLNASSVMDGRDPVFVKDGDKIGTWNDANIFHSIPTTKFDWLQIDFGSTKLVKGVHLYSRTDASIGVQMRFTEVRIGDIDAASVTPPESRICVNSLCKNTGSQNVESDLNDCSSPPLSGRYITMQKVNKDDPDQSIAYSEIDVELYV